MINTKLVKHIVVSELRWKKRFHLLSYAGVVLSLIIIGNNPNIKAENINFSIVIIGLLLPFIFAIVSPLLASSGHQNNNVNQSGSFSWKYIHSIIHDRRSFIVAHGIAGIASSLPILIFTIGYAILLNFNIFIAIFALVPLLLFITFIRLQTISGTIQLPRMIYYRYDEASSFITWIKKTPHTCHKIIHYMSLALITILLVSISTIPERPLIIIIAAAASLMFYIWLTYRYIIRIWADERLSRWNIGREYKKTLAYFVVAGLLVTSLFHFENDFFKKNGNLKNLIKRGEIARIKEMKIDKVILSKKNEKGRTPLLEAAVHERPTIVKYFLALGANPNDVTEEGTPAISVASTRCDLETIQLLIDAGADINKTNPKGLTPLFFSMYFRGCITATLFLKSLGADTSLRDSKGRNYLEFSKEMNPRRYREYMFSKKYFNNHK